MKIGTILTLVAASFLAVSQAQAQHTYEQWDGGSGQWDAGFTADWNTGTYVNSINRNYNAQPGTSDVFLNTTPGTITVDDSKSATPVTYGYMEVGSSGNWVIQGDALTNTADDNQATAIRIDGGVTGSTTITSQINITPNPTNGGSVFGNYGSNYTLTLGAINISSNALQYSDYPNPPGSPPTTTTTVSGPYTYNGNTVNTQAPLFFASNGNTIVLNGNVTTDPGLYTGMLFGNYGDASMATGTYIIKGSLLNNINGGKQFDFGSGNIVLDTNNTGTGPMVFVGAGANLPQTLLTGGAYTISNFIANQGASNAIIGGSTADLSTFSGGINAGGSGGELTYRAAAGGRVIFSGNNSGDDSYTSKDGLGTVVLNSPTGNTFTSYDATIAFEAKAGTTLITNTSGSAFGNSAKLVQVDAGATLGGSGISTQAVTVVGGGIIAPGDAGQSNLGINPSIATLHLTGGLSMASGSTLAFKLNGDPSLAGANDMIDLGAGALTLTGTTNVDFTGPIQVAIPGNWEYYTLATGTGTWSSDPTFNFTTPVGYRVDHVIYDPTGLNHTFEVDFAVIPEPSTYALMIGGLAFLAFCVRRKNRMV